MLVISNPPKMVYDDAGHLIEVILSADDYRKYLREVASEADWEALPSYIQDAIDQMWIDEVRKEKAFAVDFDSLH
jgi:hypothetical protein